jgi:hypothetical protein
MTLAEYAMMALALLKGGRTVADFPQKSRVDRDPHGATVSVLASDHSPRERHRDEMIRQGLMS